MRKKVLGMHKHPNAKSAIGGSAEFKAACAKAKTPETNRQWKKYQNKRGAAYQASRT